MTEKTKYFTALGPSFYDVRDKLFNQYKDCIFDDRTGLSKEELEKGFYELSQSSNYASRLELRSRLFEFVLENTRISVDPEDWFADHFDNCTQIMIRHRESWRKEFSDNLLSSDADTLNRGLRTGSFSAELDLGHISPGWRFLLSTGAPGILRIAEEKLNSIEDNASKEFYESVRRNYTAFIRFIGRLEKQAQIMSTEHPEAKDRMEKLSACLAALQTRAPETLYEALELAYLFHQLIEFEGEWVRSMGSFELNFGRFYEADLASGRITEEDAKELIRFFWHKFYSNTRGSGNGKNFYFGGLVDDKTDNIGPLSYLAMEVFYELNTTDPKLSIKINHKTPQKFLKLVAKCLRDGRTNMVLANDNKALEAIHNRGVSKKDSFNYLLIGCYEPAIEGMEAACNMCIKYNLAKPVELVLFNGTDPLTGELIGIDTGDCELFTSYEQFYAAYEKQMEKQLRDVQGAIKHYESYWSEINPEPFLSGTFPSCLESGRDISNSGPKYNNTGSMGAGLANAADSLMAIKKLVFDDKKYTIAQLKAMIRANFKGYERDRLYLLNRIGKWGNNLDDVDNVAKQVADSYTGYVNGTPNNRGGQFTASMFTLDHSFILGHRTGALPDGRSEGHYLAKGIGAMTGLDKAGVTAQIQSVSKLDFINIPNGSVLDLYLHPSAVDGEKGIDTLINLIQTFFAQGGYGVQFNILNADDLRKAQKHPEEYATLQVRVCGWNVYFVTLNQEQQNHFIETTMQIV